MTLKVTGPADAELALSAITYSVSVAVIVVPAGDAVVPDEDGAAPDGEAVAPGDDAVEPHAAKTTASPMTAIEGAWLIFTGVCLS
ncbi:MAG TPA: hypothetical protein VIN32_02660 [Candidatus Limnocylindria bacterium]